MTRGRIAAAAVVVMLAGACVILARVPFAPAALYGLLP
jgi:hypothetical protein